MIKALLKNRIAQIVVALGVAYFLWTMTSTKKSTFEEEPTVATAAPTKQNNMRPGSGLASALLPKEVAKGDFGEFAPSEMLAGQNFLDPRQQIGFPETIGGALRNANQQVRAEPPNPKDSFVWNNSTITAADQRRALE
ncbi:MAG: hypothetical protein CL494_04845 [Actinobacteria bacterium]|nr:hypothetical protein [Actinomycetota bacterium]|tara:strand:+ start:1912 stop:2325 length:414 start_codon:yes stop_codon:yes gene_type:complete